MYLCVAVAGDLRLALRVAVELRERGVRLADVVVVEVVRSAVALEAAAGVQAAVGVALRGVGLAADEQQVGVPGFDVVAARGAIRPRGTTTVCGDGGGRGKTEPCWIV